MDTTELLKKVRKIEIKTRGISNHIFSGEYHSAFKGRGMSFSEVREYKFGDEIRDIEWNVTARFDHPYVKVFEEERELTVMLLVDASASSFFGTGEQMKHELITELCAVIAFSAISNNDKVGIIFFTDKIEKFIPPKKGKSHILRIIRELITFKPVHQQTNVKSALQYLTRALKKKSIAFVLSDFIAEDFAHATAIAGRKHDLIGVQIYDPREKQLSDVGVVRAADSETGEVVWIDTGDPEMQKNYEEEFLLRSKKARDAFVKGGSDFLSINTEESYLKSLMKFFKKREMQK